jgi:hypothetical protein
LDKRVALDEQYIEIYQDITNFIPLLDSTDPDIIFLKELLLTLRNNLDDNSTRGANLVALNDHVQNISDKLSESEINRINVIIFSLSDGDVSAALGGNAYQQARQDILLLVPGNIKDLLLPSFNAIDEANGDRELIKSSLQAVVNILRANQGSEADQIDPLDIDVIVMPKICQILVFFAIDSEACESLDIVIDDEGDVVVPDESGDTVDNSSTSDSSLFQTILRWVLYIVILVVIVLAGVFIFYLVKARLNNQTGEEDL